MSNLSLTTTGTTGASTYNTSTGALNIPNYADTSKIVLTTSGTTNAANYNPSTGALNIPNYEDVSHIVLSTTGSTGASTFNTSTGALHIPNYADISKLSLTTPAGGGAATYTSRTLNIPTYAPKTVNQVSVSTAITRTSASVSPVSTGYGVAFTAAYSTSALINFYSTDSVSSSNPTCAIYVYRTTGAVPAFNTAPVD